MPPNPVQFFLENKESIQTNNLESILASGSLAVAISVIKFVFVALSVFFLIHGIYLIIRMNVVRDKLQLWKETIKRKADPVYRGEFVDRWREIEGRMKSMQEAEYKLAIIEADRLFDDLLRRMMYRGKDMSERLKNINKDFLPSIDKVWEAHKIRNNLAHDSAFHIDYSGAKRVIEYYKQALQELSILD
jgi:hypothetical protein